MDYYQQFALDFLKQHQAAAAFVVGAIATRPVLCADLVFRALMKTPLKPLFLRNAPTILAWADAFEAELKKNAEAEVKKDIPPAPAP